LKKSSDKEKLEKLANLYFLYMQNSLPKNTGMITIENKLRTAKIKIFYILQLVLIFALGAYYLFEPNEEYVRTAFLIILLIIIVAYFSMLALRLNYFFLQDTGDSLLVRYYSAHPFLRSYKAFKLPANTIKSYRVKSSLFNLKHELVITAESNKGRFVFPSLSLSALSKSERKEVYDILDKCAAKK
jgi:hypothetical protein